MRRLSVAALLLTATAACGYESPQAPTPLPPDPPPISTPTPPPVAPPTALNVHVAGGAPATGRVGVFTATVASVGAPPFRYGLTFGDGTDASTTSLERYVEFTHAYGRAGTYAIRLVVTDAAGQSGESTNDVLVRDPPPPPPPPAPPSPPPPSYSINITATPSSVVVGDVTTLNAMVTPTDGAPAATAFDWDCEGDGTNDTTTAAPTSTCSYSTAGSKTARMTARSASAAGSGSVTITVQAAHDLFVVITADDLTPSISQTVTFTATVSSMGPVPTTLQWSWDHTNDGTYEVTETASSPRMHSPPAYGVAGEEKIKVRVRDAATGREATSTLGFTVVVP